MRKVALHRIQSRLNQSFRQQSGLSISQWVHDVGKSHFCFATTITDEDMPTLRYLNTNLQYDLEAYNLQIQF